MSEKFIKGRHGKYHIDHPPFVSGGRNGEKHSSLDEPIPKFFARPGDGVLTAAGIQPGTDNNAMIVFGRDRTGQGELDAPKAKDIISQSGYSDHMGAGAIDIVVGRVSPFPLDVDGKSWGPLFNTKRDIPEFELELLVGVENPLDPNSNQFLANHPGIAMDASRIYISQMTDVDDNFNIQKDLHRGSTVKKKTKTRTPTAAIMLKSDKIRMHARQDIKIVTGGSFERTNSQGNDITTIGGIHLMAGNKASEQQPIPLGDNLVHALNNLSKKLDELTGIVYAFNTKQMQFNKTLGEHFHQSPFYGMATSPSITAGPHSVETIISQFSLVSQQLFNLKNNIGSFQSKYLKKGSDNYINSDHNTTN
jgi:hypothetical protein